MCSPVKRACLCAENCSFARSFGRRALICCQIAKMETMTASSAVAWTHPGIRCHSAASLHALVSRCSPRLAEFRAFKSQLWLCIEDEAKISAKTAYTTAPRARVEANARLRVADAIDHAHALFVRVLSIACKWRGGQRKTRSGDHAVMIRHWRALVSLQHSMQPCSVEPRAFDADADSCDKFKILILKTAHELIFMLTGARVFFLLACLRYHQVPMPRRESA